MTTSSIDQRTDASGGPEVRRPRVVLLIDSLGWGGAERLMLQYLPFLRDAGFDLRVCAMQDRSGNPVAADIRALGIPVDMVRVDRLRDLGAVRRLMRYLRAVDPDVVHTQLEFADVLGSVAARLRGVPSVSTLHTMMTSPRRSKTWWRNRVGDRVMARTQSAIVCVSDAARELYVAEGRYPARLLVTLRNGIDLSAYPGDAVAGARVLRGLGIPAGATVMTSVAVLRPPKGIDHAIAAMPELLRRHPDLWYLVVGDGEHRGALQAAARRLGVAERVRFAGARTDVPDVLAACDLFVHPTLTDALPTVLAEAGAAGLPIVASRVGGVPEMAIEGRNGLLVPPGDTEALRAALDRVLSEPELAAHMAAESLAVAHERFDIATQAGRLAGLYRSLIGSR